MNVLLYIHLLMLTVWLGGTIFFSFVAAPAIFRTFPRQTAGDIVGAIFPKYFLIGYVASAVLPLTLLALVGGDPGRVRYPFALLVVIATLNLVSGIMIGRKARRVKERMRATEEGAEKDALKKTFGKLHGISMMVNVTVIALALVYLAFVPTLAGLLP